MVTKRMGSKICAWMRSIHNRTILIWSMLSALWGMNQSIFRTSTTWSTTHVVEKSSKTPTSSSKIYSRQTKLTNQVNLLRKKLKPEEKVQSKSHRLLRTSLICLGVLQVEPLAVILNILWTSSTSWRPTLISPSTLTTFRESTTKSSPQTAS